MKTILEKFASAEDGAAVMDMTMLMAALTGLALAVSVQISGGMEDLSGELNTELVDHNVEAAF